MANKFKVGDILIFKDSVYDDPDCIVIKVNNEYYTLEFYPRRNHTGDFNHRVIEDCLKLHSLKIRDTRLARKLYKNCIKKEEDGYLYVQR